MQRGAAPPSRVQAVPPAPPTVPWEAVSGKRHGEVGLTDAKNLWERAELWVPGDSGCQVERPGSPDS